MSRGVEGVLALLKEYLISKQKIWIPVTCKPPEKVVIIVLALRQGMTRMYSRPFQVGV